MRRSPILGTRELCPGFFVWLEAWKETCLCEAWNKVLYQGTTPVIVSLSAQQHPSHRVAFTETSSKRWPDSRLDKAYSAFSAYTEYAPSNLRIQRKAEAEAARRFRLAQSALRLSRRPTRVSSDQEPPTRPAGAAAPCTERAHVSIHPLPQARMARTWITSREARELGTNTLLSPHARSFGRSHNKGAATRLTRKKEVNLSSFPSLSLCSPLFGTTRDFGFFFLFHPFPTLH